MNDIQAKRAAPLQPLETGAPRHSDIRAIAPVDRASAQPDRDEHRRFLGVAQSVPGIVLALGLLYVLFAYVAPLLSRLF